MDRFELNWPNVDAQLLTDGWRCRIVWRQRGRHGSGIGGTIDNNVQCVRRLAESLSASPYLLGALRARGHDQLAGQIENAVAPSDPSKPAATRAWLDALAGSEAFESVRNRRAKTWLELGLLKDEALLLRVPAPKGKSEWVLKRTWPDDSKRPAEFVAAADFKGIAAWLVGAGADEAYVDRLLHAAAGEKADALKSAAKAWRQVQAGATH